MKSKTWLLAAALLTLCAPVLVAGCGSSDTGSRSTSSSSEPSPGNATDRAFVAEMVPHHRSAVAMASIATKEASSSFVKSLAADISRSQNAEIAQMQRVDRRLAAGGIRQGDLEMDAHTMGMAMRADMLKGAHLFDAKFIQMMVPHHQGAIEMARVELAKGSDAELKKLAQNIIAAQQREVKEMRAHAKGSGGMDMSAGHHSG